jgi:pSer/pThr/pTyr-binding forkhead associated (FHA) protein
METLIVQIGLQRRRTLETARSVAGELRVGRAFDNDLIIGDPYVDPHQLRFYRDDDTWYVESPDRTNPVLVNGVAQLVNPMIIRAGDRLSIGRTQLRVISESEAVEPTRKLLLSSWLHQNRQGFALPALTLLAVVLLDALPDYQLSAIHLDWKPYAYGALISALAFLAWASAWAVLGRVLQHQHHFGAQLLVTALVSAICSVWLNVPEYLEFTTSNALFTDALSYGGVAVAFAILLKCNLFFATHIGNSTRVAMLVVSVIAGLLFTTVQYNRDSGKDRPEFSTVLRPQPAPMVRRVSIAAFMNDVERKIERVP